jgi:AmmeMemoRadiSam system protein B
METMAARRKRIRFPVVGELFYPADRTEALSSIRSYGLKQGRGGDARAIIAPHGAWNLSGSLAAAAFTSAAGRTGNKNPSRVVLLGPIHDRREEGLFLSNSHYFQTPLGNIRVDLETSEELEGRSPFFEINDIPHLREHSIEVLLPFIKYCFPGAEIVPVLMGRPRLALIFALAEALKTVFAPDAEDTLFVVSCNLSMAPGEAEARSLADSCVRLFAEKNGAALAAAVVEGRLNVCGGGLVAGLLHSGLLNGMEMLPLQPRPLGISSDGNIVCYGAFSFA